MYRIVIYPLYTFAHTRGSVIRWISLAWKATKYFPAQLKGCRRAAEKQYPKMTVSYETDIPGLRPYVL